MLHTFAHPVFTSLQVKKTGFISYMIKNISPYKTGVFFEYSSEGKGIYNLGTIWYLNIDCKGSPKLDLQNAPQSEIPSLKKLFKLSPELKEKVLKTCIKNI